MADRTPLTISTSRLRCLSQPAWPWFLAVTLAGLAAPASARVTRYLTGNAADVAPALAGPALHLAGGGTDVDAALQWMIDQARGCTACATTVDVVVLRASGADGYNEYIAAMPGVDSVETLVIHSARQANSAAVEATVRRAEVVFFAGGDQCKYTTRFKGTKLETAVESVYARGGAVGGTSAGMAIQGEFIYNGCVESATSADALADPYHSSVTFTYDLFAWPHLDDVLTDTHFVTRDRMGRLFAMLARQIQDGRAKTALGVAADAETSIVIDRRGLATVMGSGNAYFVLADHRPERCAVRKPLSFSDYRIWRVPPGGTYDLAKRPDAGFSTISVRDGAVSRDPY